MNNNEFIPQKKKAVKIRLVYFLLLLIFVLFVSTGYFFYQYRKLSQNPSVTQIAKQETDKLIKDVGKLMLLPKDETPTVATVSDIDKLKDQLFFKNAQNGNKVLIYPNSKLAIIYDPKTKIIVNVGPINFSPQPTPPVQITRIGLRNGTNLAGLTYKIETEIKKSMPEVDIVLKDKDKRTDYEQTIVVVLNDTAKGVAEELAKVLNSRVDKLPEGETKPEGVDILIIVGKDKN